MANIVMENIVQRVQGALDRLTGKEAGGDDSSQETRGQSSETSAINQDSYKWYLDQMKLAKNRKGKYKEYDRMDEEDPELISALDIYADNATKGDSETDTVIELSADSEKVQQILEQTTEDLKLDSEIWSIARELAKYGDEFEELVIDSKLNFDRLKYLSPKTMYHVADQYGRKDEDYPYQQRMGEHEKPIKFRDWQIVHFKLRRSRSSSYGVDGSVLYPIRKIFKQVSMMDDGVVLARLTRAQQRYGFTIDTTGIEPGQPTLDYLEQVKEGMKKKRTIDPRTGKMDLDYNPMSMEEDLFLSSKDGNGSSVQILQGSSNLGQLKDVEYLQNKKFAGIKVPKAYLGVERDVNAKATLTQQDIQFARNVRRIQIALITGLRKIYNISLILAGISPSNVEYTVGLPIISTVDELRRWEIEKIKTELAIKYKKELDVDLEWVLVNLLDMTEEEVKDALAYLDDDSRATRKLMDLKTPAQVIDDNPQNEAEELTDREIRLAKMSMREELETLKELVDWELESKRGHGILDQRELEDNDFQDKEQFLRSYA
jgi:hypothetical protein